MEQSTDNFKDVMRYMLTKQEKTKIILRRKRKTMTTTTRQTINHKHKQDKDLEVKQIAVKDNDLDVKQIAVRLKKIRVPENENKNNTTPKKQRRKLTVCPNDGVSVVDSPAGCPVSGWW